VERATVAVYERHASDWTERRSPGDLQETERFRALVAEGAVRVDLGCGPGWHLPGLGHPVVALDAARAMLVLARERASNAWLVQGDIEALPFRDGALDGAWSRATYLHVERARLPLALARLHWALRLDAPLYLSIRHGDGEGLLDQRGDFPDRFFAEWRDEPVRAVLTGAGFSVDTVRKTRGDRADFLVVWARRARSLPDTVGPDMRLLVCGLNPSIYAADGGVGYARPGNRFWPAARLAGLVGRDRDPLHALCAHGLGMTDLVKRATRSASELSATDYEEGAARVERLVRWLRPGAVCFVGLTGYRAAVDHAAEMGEQRRPFGGVPAYLMPSTSGANAHARLDELAAHLRAAAALANRGHGSTGRRGIAK
jgi:TDG/mug DNA glycosylase family protein